MRRQIFEEADTVNELFKLSAAAGARVEVCGDARRLRRR
jgi:hypothetical protein